MLVCASVCDDMVMAPAVASNLHSIWNICLEGGAAHKWQGELLQFEPGMSASMSPHGGAVAPLAPVALRARYLTARCLHACENHEECIALLEVGWSQCNHSMGASV